MGHSLCAAGLLDVVLATKVLQEQLIPAVPETNIAKSCQAIDLVTEHRQLHNRPSALVINRGFASMNAVAIIQACD